MSETSQKPKIKVEGVAEAPMLIFDEIPFFGIMPGMNRLTLSAFIQDEDGKGGVGVRRVVVAHLRFNDHALTSLRGALDGIAALKEPPSAEKPN